MTHPSPCVECIESNRAFHNLGCRYKGGMKSLVHCFDLVCLSRNITAFWSHISPFNLQIVLEHAVGHEKGRFKNVKVVVDAGAEFQELFARHM